MTERIICNDNGGELREMAAVMSERGSAIGLDYGMGRGLADAARMMREAADTIEVLRKQVAKCQIAELKADCDTSHMSDETTLLKAENAKLQDENDELRELVRDMWHEGAFAPGACYVEAAERLEERTRELGIEVE